MGKIMIKVGLVTLLNKFRFEATIEDGVPIQKNNGMLFKVSLRK